MTPAFVHGRMLEQCLLDLLRADVQAVMHDDLLPAAAEPQIAVSVRLHQAAGIEPAIAEGGSRRGHILPIADRRTERMERIGLFSNRHNSG
jgi:hypothetical protein